ncbi:hypothetical protein MTR_3g467020 [Medicago truncatula]|uniref:Uncharacterized protein n=1 Tax=Medicago truncatula TaxID=3880 RepID=A0A072UYG5_MEDTR|nr:hypothetical protein MTR_3g467020 [Medicago truncatula]
MNASLFLYQICPVCDESLGEDAIRMVKNSSFPISQKKDASWEHNKHEPMPDSISPAFKDNVYLPSLNYILSDEEDTIRNASDVVVEKDTSIAKRYGPLKSICYNGDMLIFSGIARQAYICEKLLY